MVIGPNAPYTTPELGDFDLSSIIGSTVSSLSKSAGEIAKLYETYHGIKLQKAQAEALKAQIQQNPNATFGQLATPQQIGAIIPAQSGGMDDGTKKLLMYGGAGLGALLLVTLIAGRK